MLSNVHVVRQPELNGYVSNSRITGLPEGEALSVLEVAATQASWFASGHSGCVFARLAALKDHGWHFVVAESLDLKTAHDVATVLPQLMTDPSCEVISLLLPFARTEAEGLEAIAKLCESGLFFVEQAVIDGERRSAYVRLPVAEGVVAWVMAFGPFDNMPATRRAPYFELAMRVRPKTGELFHRLNGDATIAHLADLPMAMPEHFWEQRWASTLQRTRRILGGDPDSFSAARCTFTTTSATWNAIGIEALAERVVDNHSQIADYGSSETA